MKASLKVKLLNPKFYIVLAFIICIICTIIFYPFLPNDLPMQFSISGAVNWTLPKALGVLCIPSIALFISAASIKSDSLNFGNMIPIILILCVDVGVLFYAAFIM